MSQQEGTQAALGRALFSLPQEKLEQELKSLEGLMNEMWALVGKLSPDLAAFGRPPPTELLAVFRKLAPKIESAVASRGALHEQLVVSAETLDQIGSNLDGWCTEHPEELRQLPESARALLVRTCVRLTRETVRLAQLVSKDMDAG